MNIERGLKTVYQIECYDSQGALKWRDDFSNMVVDAGLNDSLDKHLKGSAYTAAWFVGLAGASPTFNANDTMASHPGWTDAVNWSQAARPALVLGAVVNRSVDNSASRASFSIDAGGTIGGAFITNSSTKGGITGILYGGGAFTGGNWSVQSGDTINVAVTLTAASL